MAKKSAIRISLNVDSIINDTIDELIRDGLRAMAEAHRTAEYTTRTGNLEDSYGCAVYVDGQLIERSICTFDPIAKKPRFWYGRAIFGKNEILSYLRSYRPRSKGISLVLVAAMPYYEILEKGLGNLKRKYKVITGANSVMREIARKYEGRFGGRRKQGVATIHLKTINNG